jgi:hypothetical protein
MLLRRLRRPQFNIRGLLLLTAVAAVALAIATRPRPVEVYALLHMRSPGECKMSLGIAPRPEAQVRFPTIREVTSALTSDAVLTSVTEDPSVARLPIIKSQSDPVGWIRQRLRVEQLQSSEIVGVYATVGARHVEDAKVIVNSVVRMGIEQSMRLERLRADESEIAEIAVLQQASVRW